MPRSEPIPAPEDAESLTAAAIAWFGPCSCMRSGGRVHICAGHAFLHDDPTQRGLVKQWQRLLFMRTERERLLAGEGIPSPTSTPGHVLPW